MTFQEKIDAMTEDLKEKGIKKRTSAPLPFRWLWKINIRTRPPLFLNTLIDYLIYIIINLITCVIVYNFLMFLFSLIGMVDFPNENSLLSSIILGTLLTLINIISNTYKAKKLDLPDWEEYIKHIENKNKNDNS